MIEASDITDIENARIWAVEHDTKVLEWWKQQHSLNAEVKLRLLWIERRIYGLALLSGAGGGGVFFGASKFFGG